MKLEFVDDNVYAVFAKYVQLNGQGRVLEMVYKIREELLLEAYGRTTFMEYVNSYNQQFYQDVLTGAYNRRFYEEQAKTDHIYNGVVMIDGNHFKQINDQFGHAAGDAALRTVAQTVLGLASAPQTGWCAMAGTSLSSCWSASPMTPSSASWRRS